MKKLKINILKESSTSAAEEQSSSSEKVLVVVAGDSIAVGMCYHALKAVAAISADKKGKINFINIIPGYDAVKGGMRARWINSQLNLERYKDYPGKKILIIIAGTNDAINWGAGGSISASSAASEVTSMISKGKSAGFECTAMKLHEYTGKKPNRQPGTDWKKRHEEFISQFNTKIGPKTFEMVTPGNDGVHAPYNSTANEKLLDNALSSLGVKKENIIIPAEVGVRGGQKSKGKISQLKTPLQSQGVSKKTEKSGCNINPYCNCVDRLVRDEVTVLGVQKALNKLGISVKETGYCDEETKVAIQTFQTSQQDTYKPKDRDTLRCDACVGVNTTDAINLQLKTLGGDETLQSISSAAPSSNFKLKVAPKSSELQVVDKNVPRGLGTRIRKYYPIINKWAEKFNFPVDVAMGIVYTESGFNPNVVSHAGAAGLMQLMVITAKDIKMNPDRRFDPEENVRGALKYISQYLPRYLKKDMKTYKVKFSWDSLTRKQKIRLQLYSYNMGARAAVKGYRMYRFDNIEDYFNHLKKSYEKRAGYDYSLKALKFSETWRDKYPVLSSDISENFKPVKENRRLTNMSKKININIVEGACGACGDSMPQYKNAHNGEEARMHRTTLAHLMADVKVLLDLVQDSDDLPEWLETKITKAGDYMSSAARYIAGNKARDMGQLEEQQVDLAKLKELATASLQGLLADIDSLTDEQLSQIINMSPSSDASSMTEGLVGLTEEILIESHFTLYDYLQDAIDENGEYPCPQCLYEVLSEASCGCPDLIPEAKYRGRKVKLNKPMRGDVKKFKVYVKNAKGNVVKVNFGHGGSSARKKGEKTMKIRKSNKKARKSFRARHNCKSPGPKWKARYWSCRKW